MFELGGRPRTPARPIPHPLTCAARLSFRLVLQVFKGTQDDLSLLQVVAKILGLTPDEVSQCTAAIKARKAAADAGYLGQLELPDLTSYLPTGFLGGSSDPTSS